MQWTEVYPSITISFIIFFLVMVYFWWQGERQKKKDLEERVKRLEQKVAEKA